LFLLPQQSHYPTSTNVVQVSAEAGQNFDADVASARFERLDTPNPLFFWTPGAMNRVEKSTIVRELPLTLCGSSNARSH
jgi:hypothetical protein